MHCVGRCQPPPLTNWLRLQQTFPSQFHKCHQMLWRRGEWTLGPQTTPLSLVDLCHCLLIFMFWALLGGLSFCRHCISRPQVLVWSEDYLTFISPSHLNQFLTFYETLLTNDFVKISITHWTLLKYDCLLIFILNWWNVSVCFINSLRGANRVWWEQCTHHCRPFAFWSFCQNYLDCM